MAIVTQTINVDLRPHYNRRNQSMVYCSQYDNDMRNIVLNIANEGEPVDVSTYTIYIEGTKPDKHGFSYELTSIGGSVSNNVITVPLQTQMTAVAGLTNAEVVLYSNDERIGSANFILNVEKAGLAEDVDISETDIPAYVDGAQQAAAEATQAKDDAVSAKDTAVSAAETAQTVLDSIPEDYTELSDSVLDLKSALEQYEDIFTGDVDESVQNWLDVHPEATTTVQDHSLTYEKLVNGTLGFVTPEMYGAKGDGTTDDTTAMVNAFKAGAGLLVLKEGATYLVSDLYVDDVENLSVIGYGATIKVKKEFTFLSYLQRCCLRLENCKQIKVEGVTFDASWREIKELHQMEVDTTLENYCVRLMGGNDTITFHKCVFGNQLKVCIQAKGSWLGGDYSNIDPNFVPNTNIDIGYCTFGWNYTPGLHNGAIQFLELPQVATDINAKIHDNLILMSGVHGIHIYYGNNNVTIENNTVLNSGHCVLEPYFIGGGAVVNGYGIEVTSCNKITIKNNYVHNFIQGGIFIFDDHWYTDGDIKDVIIANNIVEQDTDYSDEFIGHGITMLYCYNGAIFGNVCKNMLQTKNNGSTCNGIITAYSKHIIISDNVIEKCQMGISASYSDFVNIQNNIIKSLTNAFGNSKGITFYNNNNINCVGNIIDRGDSELTNYGGIELVAVANCVVAGNNLQGMRYGILDNSGAITNATVFGTIFNSVTNKYVWWGHHTGLVVDFVAVADN